MIRLNNKANFYQWDINQKIAGSSAKYIDFMIAGEVYRVENTADGCPIPDEFFQTAGKKTIFEAYADGTYTEHHVTVEARPMPPDYIFTPTQRETFDSLTEKVTATAEDLERRAASGEFNGKDGRDGEQGPAGPQGIQGPRGDRGEVGPAGPKGDKGDTGDKGDKGDKGDQGDKGNDGSSLLSGHGVPTDTLGKDEDSYIDLDTWDYYTKSSGTWIKQGNIKGDKGDSPESEKPEGTFGLDYYPLEDGTLGVKVGKASELSNIVIPSKYMGYTVSTILDSAFADCANLKSIIIPDTITTMGKRAFSNCQSLTSIAIPNTITTIDEYTFYRCYSLTSFDIPNSVTSIGDWAFNNCGNLNKI